MIILIPLAFNSDKVLVLLSHKHYRRNMYSTPAELRIYSTQRNSAGEIADQA